MSGHIILLNGASSAGKSTLAQALQQRLPLPFWHWSIDHLRAARVLPHARIDAGEFAWGDLREAFFDGFHRSIPALAAAGNHLIVEHIVETRAWMHRLLRLLDGHDVYFVGVHCPLDELERRERARGDRRIGEARADHAVVHTHGRYDVECDTTAGADAAASQVAAAWARRSRPAAFETLRAALRDAAAGA